MLQGPVYNSALALKGYAAKKFASSSSYYYYYYYYYYHYYYKLFIYILFQNFLHENAEQFQVKLIILLETCI